jgi:hypothetical protein
VGNAIFVGGGFGGDNTAFLLTGGAGAWPALPGSAVISNNAAELSANVQVINSPASPAGVYASGAGDMDGDGNADMVFSAQGAGEQSFVLYGGRFERVPLANPCGGAAPTFGSFFAGGVDLDGDVDGRPDFVVANRNNKRVVVFDQDLASTDCLGRPPSQFGLVMGLAGDIDGDGSEDLIVTHGDDDPGKVEAYIFYNDGQGRFGTADPTSNDPEIRQGDVLLATPALRKLGVAGLGDFDNDGRADVGVIVKQPAPDNFELVIYH